MSELTLRDLIFGKSSWEFIRLVVTLASVGMLVGGFLLILSDTAGQGSIDLKLAFVQGKLQSGSVGLLFTFLGIMLLLAVLISRATSRVKIFRDRHGALRIDHSGAFTKEKAEAIRLALQSVKREHGAAESSARTQDSPHCQ